MALETGSYIGDLNPANPPGTDPKSQGDDHIRLIKTALKDCFPGIAGAIICDGADGGLVNAYTVTPSNSLLAYTPGMFVIFSPLVTNSGTSTINISGLGATPLRQAHGAETVPGDLVSGCQYVAQRNGASEFRLIGPTKNYIDQLAFGSALPAQAGHANEFLTTDGTTASFSPAIYTSVMRFVDGADTTKKIAFNISDISTGNIRNILFGDRDIDLSFSYIKVSDQKPTGTSGGLSVAADITQTRTLNTVEINTINGASLSANQLTLPAGTYRYNARVPAFQSNSSKAFLYNQTDALYVGIGTSVIASAFADSIVSGQFTIPSPKIFTIRHYTSGAIGSGLGAPASSGQVEIYTTAEFWKVA